MVIRKQPNSLSVELTACHAPQGQMILGGGIAPV